jgi:hypothetical protein
MEGKTRSSSVKSHICSALNFTAIITETEDWCKEDGKYGVKIILDKPDE